MAEKHQKKKKGSVLKILLAVLLLLELCYWKQEWVADLMQRT